MGLTDTGDRSGVARVVTLMQLRALGSDRGGSTFVDFFELLTVGVVAHRFGKGGQEVVADFQAVALAFETAINEP